MLEREEIGRDVIRQDVLQQLSVVMAQLSHVLQLLLRLQLPQEIQARRLLDLPSAGVVH